MKKIRLTCIRIASVLAAACMTAGSVLPTIKDITFSTNDATQNETAKPMGATGFENDLTRFFDGNVVQQLPDNVSQDAEISVIVELDGDDLMETYEKSNVQTSLSSYIQSYAGRQQAKTIEKQQDRMVAKLKKAKIDFVAGESYQTIMNAFEITIKARDFQSVSNALGGDVNLILGEEYEKASADVVTNDVDVYGTGIFNSSNCEYQGEGVVVAVLDTGLDYTHTAFLEKNFKGNPAMDALTLNEVKSLVPSTRAAELSKGLTGEDVYLNRKVPFAYDYADKDADVFPIDSQHGTHVAGVIAANDSLCSLEEHRVNGKQCEGKRSDCVVLKGVSPKAQLAIMKVFSDTAQGAKSSWILAGVEDCVNMGVDVINMSLGTSCGFTREQDNQRVNEVYDRVREAGISLIVAASNDNNATAASTKNGSNGLTSNPDSGTVGSPSTYEGALSVASVDGVKTPYLINDGKIIYFKEASTSGLEKNNFVEEILKKVDGNPDTHDFEYVHVNGTGVASDYDPSYDYTGKIVLVRRGVTTFEDKVRVALKTKGAAGIIIYNNVSGSISMSVGANGGAVCSISQDEGEKLALKKTGIITISRNNVAGPYMSDFSSWGPTSDLRIKPEITSHGGEILSAVPGQDYDRLSGTSMAAPNQAGATALIRQYVKYSGVFGTFNETPEDARKITDIVNQLMMSTADIVRNQSGLPYAVRKQGSGLVSITKATTTAAYLTTFDQKGNPMDKSKLELGDDKDEDGVYTMSFAIHNISNNGTASYELDNVVLTEGVSSAYTSHGDRTVTMEGYELKNTQMDILSVTGGTLNGKTVSVNAGQTAKVDIKLSLSQEAKTYLKDSFEHGMYVEGFIKLKPTTETVGNKKGVQLSVPFLAFFGDWTEAPIFDEEYFDTNKDEVDQGIDPEDKIMEDAYATRVYGSLYSDYIAYLGSYYFVQDPSKPAIAADKDHISISNLEGESNFAINSIASIPAGLLRNVKEANITIVEDSTGEEVFNVTKYNLRKSYSAGGGIAPSTIGVNFSTLEHDLKNNTKYTVTLEAFIDYGEKDEQNNVRNVFEFPVYIDYEAPIVTDVSYRTEYNSVTKKTKLFADLSVYDNHYAMAIQPGQIIQKADSAGFSMDTFGRYLTPIYSSFNSTSKVSIELTDYIERIKNSVSSSYDENGELTVKEGTNTIVAICYDYALNCATYEIELPDEIIDMAWTEEEIVLNPYETLDLTTVLNAYPVLSWEELIDFEITEQKLDVYEQGQAVISVSAQTLLAQKSGTATLTAVGYDKDGNRIAKSIHVHVLGEGDEGYYGGYTPPKISKFALKGYSTEKAFYTLDDRDIGLQGGYYSFGSSSNLSMYPSEQVKVDYEINSYYPDATKVRFSCGNDRVAKVTEDGMITAVAKGNAIISVEVLFRNSKTGKYESTNHGARIVVSVKDPYSFNSIYLNYYRGDEEIVNIPSDRGVTMIYQYAFSGMHYIDKDLANGDVIDPLEDPLKIKPHYYGQNDNVKKIIIPKGITEIQQYAFAGMDSLEEVVLPSTLTKIGVGAFENCKKLKTINLENVKFINKKAFYNTALQQVNLASVVSIGDYTFENCKLIDVELPESSQSIGVGAFLNNTLLNSVTFKAKKIKVGTNAFEKCSALTKIEINAAVIPAKAFYGCTNLKKVVLGKDVAIINEFAFSGTGVEEFEVNFNNTLLSTDATGTMVMKDGELIMVAPKTGTNSYEIPETVQSIASGAFSGNTMIYSIKALGVKSVGEYAFADCTNLDTVNMPLVETIGGYAFYNTKLTQMPASTQLKNIGAHAFEKTRLNKVVIVDNATIGDYAFADNSGYLEEVEIGANVTIGEYAFYNELKVSTVERKNGLFYQSYYTPYIYEVKDEDGNVVAKYRYYVYNFEKDMSVNKLTSVEVGADAKIGAHAFDGNWKLNSLTLGDGAKIGAYAFYNNKSLTRVDLSGVKEIGEYAFTGEIAAEFELYQVTTYKNGKTYKENYLRYAYEREYRNGQVYSLGVKYSHFAPAIESINLSNLETLGAYAFAFNENLTEIVLGQKLTDISEAAFYNCKSLVTMNFTGSGVKNIGEGAFYGVGIKQIDLTGVETVGPYSFSRTALESVTFEDGATIGEAAFEDARSLAVAGNLGKVTVIGARAFHNTKLTEADLTSAISVGDLAFQDSLVASVKFGENLQQIGENPIAGCPVQTFARYEDELFNGQVIGTKTVTTYDISDKVKVIDDVIYATVPNGLELIAYPQKKADASYTVVDGTVRISARAFQGAPLRNVTIAYTVKAIGDKAFYECENLSMVVFTSYDAPILEEAFDASYVRGENAPLTGTLPGIEETYEGLGISKFYMWNSTSINNFYYGANFVDYIGHIDTKIVMVRPENGKNYDSFIFGQYFATTVDGHSAADETTLRAKALISLLPKNVTLQDEAKIVEARQAFDAIASYGQKELVDNLKMLEDAESALAYLKRQQEQQKPVEPETPPTSSSSSSSTETESGCGSSLTVASGLWFLAPAAFIMIKRRKSQREEKED